MNIFTEQGLNSDIVKAITELGFEQPTPVQEKTIPAILDTGEDLIALAQTGTGKTAGFGLPIIQQIETDNKTVQSLILCPTRELCLQITNDLKSFTKYQKNIKVEAVYGGASIVPQLNALKSGLHIVVGTPGRTLDLIKRKALKVNHLKWLVLDEADEMLNMGFKDELDGILETTPKEKQTLLFSATMPAGVRHIANQYMNNPTEITIGKKNQGADNVEHQYYVVRAADRYLALKRLADFHVDIYGIVFCRTRRETKDVADKLIQDGYNADALHGDLSQAQRDHVMQRFRQRHLQLLVATDVAARGLDVNDLTHVINYNLPDDPEVYIHRSGRTGRAGKKGISVAITHSRETRKVKSIEKLLNKKFKHESIPGGKEICKRRLFNVIDKVEKVEVDESKIGSFLPEILKKLEQMDRDELIKRFVSVEFNQFLSYYKNASDLNVAASNSREGKSGRMDKSERPERGSNGFTRFYINIGSKLNINASNLIGLINDQTQKRNIEIGKIDILRNFSFFEVDKQFEKLILSSFNGASYQSTPLQVQVSTPVNDNQNKGRGKRSSSKPAFKKRSSQQGKRKRKHS